MEGIENDQIEVTCVHHEGILIKTQYGQAILPSKGEASKSSSSGFYNDMRQSDHVPPMLDLYAANHDLCLRYPYTNHTLLNSDCISHTCRVNELSAMMVRSRNEVRVTQIQVSVW
jgi:hypothetical protein